jgi:hypothetical protein
VAKIPLSAKAFAEFALGGPSKRAQIVRGIQKPKSKATRAVVLYYARAIRIIRAYHAQKNDQVYLGAELTSLEIQRTKATTPQLRATLTNNMRAIRGYINAYGQRKRQIVPCGRIHYEHGSVRLSGSPDFAVEENGKIKLVKLGLTKDGDDPDVVRIMLRVIYQAAEKRFQIDPQDVVYFDIANSRRTHGHKNDAELATTIDNGCEALEAMI